MSVFQPPETIELHFYTGGDTEFTWGYALNGTPQSLAGKKVYIELENGIEWTTDTGHWTTVDSTTVKFRVPKTEVPALNFSEMAGTMFLDIQSGTKEAIYLVKAYKDRRNV